MKGRPFKATMKGGGRITGNMLYIFGSARFEFTECKIDGAPVKPFTVKPDAEGEGWVCVTGDKPAKDAIARQLIGQAKNHLFHRENRHQSMRGRF